MDVDVIVPVRQLLSLERHNVALSERSQDPSEPSFLNATTTSHHTNITPMFESGATPVKFWLSA